MEIEIALQTAPLFLPEGQNSDRAGAVVRFEGRVRAEENGAVITALDYEAYEPMARRQLEKIAGELEAQHPCLAVRVRHRLGRVPVGEASILIEARAKHRAEAFAFVTEFMDRLKQDVPIWKAVAKP
jgi:molybdopterin synthase catalytic subunit